MNRREFSAPVKREIRARSGGVCECDLMTPDIRGLFPKVCTRPAVDIDHVYADCLEREEDKQGPLTAADGADLCKPCHKIKTASDQGYRRKRNAHAVRKGRPKKGFFNGPKKKIEGRNDNWPKGQKIKSASRWPAKGSRKLQSRGFGA